MDYEGLCKDLLDMEHSAGFFATGWFSSDKEKTLKLVAFAAGCRDFRHELFVRGYGNGGY